jgi:hypothetical protein
MIAVALTPAALYFVTPHFVAQMMVSPQMETEVLVMVSPQMETEILENPIVHPETD